MFFCISVIAERPDVEHNSLAQILDGFMSTVIQPEFRAEFISNNVV